MRRSENTADRPDPNRSLGPRPPLLGQLLGLSADEIAELATEGVT